MVPDEISHFGYAQYFAETGSPPPQTPGLQQYSPQETAALDGTWFNNVIGTTLNRGVFTSPDEVELHAIVAASNDPVGSGALRSGGTTTATNQPPLYYALEAIPYWLSPTNNIFTRL